MHCNTRPAAEQGYEDHIREPEAVGGSVSQYKHEQLSGISVLASDADKAGTVRA